MMNVPTNVCYVEVRCEDGTRARIRADELATVLERNTKDGRRVTIPTRAKTLLTCHTLEQIWEKLKDALGGGPNCRVCVVDLSPTTPETPKPGPKPRNP